MHSIFGLQLTIICLVLSKYSCEYTDKKISIIKANDFSIILTLLALTSLTIFILLIYLLISYRLKKNNSKKKDGFTKLENHQSINKSALRASFDLDQYFVNECKKTSIKSLSNKLYKIPATITTATTPRTSRAPTPSNHDRSNRSSINSNIILKTIQEDDDK